MIGLPLFFLSKPFTQFPGTNGSAEMNWQRLNTLRNRLLLLFFAITASAIGFVYLYVVPQLESNLTAQKISRLETQGSAQVARLRRSMHLELSQAGLGSMLAALNRSSRPR